MRFNPAAMLAALERRQVRYVLIGGLAANAHGARRTTGDVDVIVDRSRENIERPADRAVVVEVFGTRVPVVGLDDLIALKRRRDATSTCEISPT